MSLLCPTVDLAPFFVDEGVVVGAEPTPAQTAVAKQIDAVPSSRHPSLPAHS